MSAPTSTAPPSAHGAEDEGYQKALKPRQLQMIAIGGAIGTGLFLGAGGRLASAGPGLFIVYGVCGVFVFLILRALGELVLHRPSSGSFVSYAREFYGERFAYVAGWMYFVNWAMTSIVDVTAIATYAHYWGAAKVVPQWVIALAALLVVLSMNVISVKLFGELEFYAALLKVLALTAFLVVGVVFLAGRFDIEGQATGFGVVSGNGGLFPTGALPLVLVTSGVVFAYAAVELVGTAAGETADPEKIMPKAINTVILRIAVFYVGSLVLLGLLLPYTAYDAKTSPFVTFFSRIGLPGAGSMMNVIVLTAALSSLNAGLYSTGRILRSMAVAGSAPRFTGKMSRNGVPYGGILLTGCFTLLGVGLNAIVPERAFNIVLEISALGIVAAWGTIVLCQLKMFRMSQRGEIERPHYKMFGAPYTGYATLAFLLTVLVLIGLNGEDGLLSLSTLVVIIPALVIGWFVVRKRVLAVAAEREGYTGEYPVVAQRPGDQRD